MMYAVGSILSTSQYMFVAGRLARASFGTHVSFFDTV